MSLDVLLGATIYIFLIQCPPEGDTQDFVHFRRSDTNFIGILFSNMMDENKCRNIEELLTNIGSELWQNWFRIETR